MSRENVDVLRAGVEALNRGDVGAAFKEAAPDYELDNSRAIGIDRGVYDLDSARRLLEQFISMWASAAWGLDDFIEAGEHVVTPFTNVLRGRDGIEVRARGFWVWTFRNGKVARCCLYQDRNEAFEAAGLRE